MFRRPTGIAPLTQVPAAFTPRAKALYLSVAGVVLLGNGLPVAFSLLGGVFFGPEQTVERYFDALGEGDAEQALRYVDDGAELGRATGSYPLLTPGVLSAEKRPTELRIQAVEHGEPDRNGERRATVKVDFSLGSQPVPATYQLRSRSSETFPTWTVTNPFTQLTVHAPEAAGPVSVNGVPLPPAALAGPLPAFPGHYEVRAAASPLLAATHQSVDAAPGSPAEVRLQPVLAPQAGKVADQAVRKLLTDCASSPERMKERCPWLSTGYRELSNAKWHITRYPRLSVTLGEGQVQVTTKEPGSATYTGSWAFFGETQQESQEISLAPTGKLALDQNGAPVLHTW